MIVGHSERRETFSETDDTVAKKARRAVEAGLLPIVCVGETKEERDAGGMWEKVSGQITRVIEELEDADGESVVFAYEPIWAIGTGDTATPEDAQDAIGKIRDLLKEEAGEDFAGSVRILYGGSVKPENARGDHGAGRHRRRPGRRGEPRGRIVRRADRGRPELRHADGVMERAEGVW